MLRIRKKQKIIEEHRIHEKDTGSPEVQVAILTEQISQLAKHLKKHPKDHHSRMGLLKIVSARKSFLKYLAKKDKGRFESLLKKVDLKSKKK